MTSITLIRSWGLAGELVNAALYTGTSPHASRLTASCPTHSGNDWPHRHVNRTPAAMCFDRHVRPAFSIPQSTPFIL